MRPVKILTDSCSDLDKELREKYDIDYLRMKNVREGEEMWASLDFEYYSPQKIYEDMRNGIIYKTTQVPRDEFERVFNSCVDDGFDVIYIACCSKQSGSVGLGEVVAKEVMEKNPEAKIYAVDSLNACMGEGMLAIRAAEYRDQGLSCDEIYEKIMADRNLVNEYITVHTLDALKRSGRIKASKAFFGNLLGVKPIITSDAVGAQVPVKKAKGRLGSLREVVALLKESIVDPENQTVYLVHADSPDDAEELKKIVLEEIPCKDVHVSYIGPIIGASIGPEAIGLFAFGKEVTFEG